MVHYSNPGAYPSLMRARQLLRSRGHAVHVVGIDRENTLDLIVPSATRETLTLVPSHGKKTTNPLLFSRFIYTLQSLKRTGNFDVVYVSDPPACWSAAIVFAWADVRILYHEHDAPNYGRALKNRAFALAWRQVARRAVAVSTPNSSRSEMLRRESGRTDCVWTVWNCPTHSEIRETDKPAPRMGSRRKIVYAGSINRNRVPPGLVCALAEASEVELTLIGYETISSRGYNDELRHLAESLGVGDRLRLRGPMPHDDLIEFLGSFDLCFAAIEKNSSDINAQHMAGASNKTFEALAQGLALIVTDTPEWIDMFVATGVAKACDPNSEDSLIDTLKWVATHPNEVYEMGKRGRARVLTDWNYERQFAPILKIIESSGTEATS